MSASICMRWPSCKGWKTERLGSRKVTRTTSPSLPGLRGPLVPRPVGSLVSPWVSWADLWGFCWAARTARCLGSLIDLDTAEEAESVLGTMARAIQPGKTALLAEATEPAVEVVDGEMERLGGKVVRRPVVDVEAEIAAAEEAARSAEAEARRKIREQKTTERREKVQEKIDELKAKWNTYGSLWPTLSSRISDDR